MELGIEGKVAMVAASSKGIGLAIASALSAEGCSLSICARNEDALEAASNQLGGNNRSYVVDVSNPDDLEWWYQQTADDLGKPQILVTNTGGPPAVPSTLATDEQWQTGIDATLMNVIRLSRLVAPGTIDAGWGRIVHITSLVAKEPSTLLSISSTLRAGLMALTRVQSTELAPKGITVNAVLPGHTRTDRQLHLAKIRSEQEGISEHAALTAQAQAVPVGRLAEASEIAAAVAFLCSQPAAYISGINLLVDGGLTKGLA